MNIAPVGSGAVAVPMPQVAAPAAPAQSNAPVESNVTVQSNAAAQAGGAAAHGPANPTAQGGSQPPAATVQELVQVSSVSPSILQMAQGDGDGLTGVAALNDGDAAAQQAAQAAKMG